MSNSVKRVKKKSKKKNKCKFCGTKDDVWQPWGSQDIKTYSCGDCYYSTYI